MGRVNHEPTSTDTRHVVICTTGGTIAAATGPDGVVSAGAAPALLAAELEAVLPETVRVTWRRVMDVDSSAMGPADLDAVLDAVAEVLGVDGAGSDGAGSDQAGPDAGGRVDGVVVAHGTDTLEETAMLLDLHHADPRPVVVTGAQRAADHPESDGPANLLDAVLVAADEVSRGLGVLVVLGRAVLQARGVRKWHTSELLAFARNAPDPAEDVDPESLPEELRRPVLPRRVRLADVRVDVLAAAPGGDDAALRAVQDAGADGIVVEGFGSGNVPPALASGLRSALEARPDLGVVVTSRVPRGEVTAVYGGTGGGAELARSGVLFSGHLRAGQAWVLLACLLQVATGPAELRRDWDRFARVTA